MSRKAQALPGDLIRLRSGRTIYNAVKANGREWFHVTPEMLCLVLTVGPSLYRNSESASGTLLVEGQVISVELGAFGHVRRKRDE